MANRKSTKKATQMSGERAWVETVKSDIEKALKRKNILVQTGRRLPYALHISGYPNNAGEPDFTKPEQGELYPYQTDLLILERQSDGKNWVPRVVVEFKLGDVSTHDALTYSAKAATHKNVHPYLRYGIVVGNFSRPVPRRLIRHGHHFDFMLTLGSKKLSDAHRKQLVQLLTDEVTASQELSKLYSRAIKPTLLHRKLVIDS